MKIKPAEKSGGVIVELGSKESHLSRYAFEELALALPVFRLQKILVPVDFSECTEKALSYALSFASVFVAEVTLLHVVQTPRMPAAEAGVIAYLEPRDAAATELRGLRDRIAGKVQCNALLREGIAHQEIITAAKERGSDLIILSTHGRRGLERLVLGSTAEKVVRYAGCPVLIVRDNEHEFITDRGLNLPAASPYGNRGADKNPPSSD